MSNQDAALEQLSEIAYAEWCRVRGGTWLSWAELVRDRPEFAARWRSATHVVALKVATAFVPDLPADTAATTHAQLMRELTRNAPAVDDLSGNPSTE